MAQVDYKALERMLGRSTALKGAVLRILRKEGDMGDAGLDDIAQGIDRVMDERDAFDAKLNGTALPEELIRRVEAAGQDFTPLEPTPNLRRRAPKNRR